MTAMFCKRGIDIGKKTEAQVKARMEIFGAVSCTSPLRVLRQSVA